MEKGLAPRDNVQTLSTLGASPGLSALLRKRTPPPTSHPSIIISGRPIGTGEDDVVPACERQPVLVDDGTPAFKHLSQGWPGGVIQTILIRVDERTVHCDCNGETNHLLYRRVVAVKETPDGKQYGEEIQGKAEVTPPRKNRNPREQVQRHCGKDEHSDSYVDVEVIMM